MSRSPAKRRAIGPSVLACTCVALWACLWACRVSIEERRRVVSRDEGTLCFGSTVAGDGGASFGVDLREGEALPIAVKTGCLSNACSTQRAAKCSVSREGEKLVVKSELSWTGPQDLGYACPEQCTPLEARCMSDALPAGKYRVVLGRQSVEVAIPSHRASSCVEAAPRVVPKPPPPPATSAPAPPAAPAPPLDPNVTPAPPGTGVAPEPPPTDKICISPGRSQADRALRVGQPIALTVLHPNKCEGAACSGAPAKCTIKRQGKRLVLSAQFPSSTTKPRVPCTEDCKPFVATCKTDGLPAGLYTIEHGDQRVTVQIPLANAPLCD